MSIISKDEFIKAISKVKAVHEYQDGLNTYFSKNGCDGNLYQPDCTDTVLNLLHTIFGKADENEWISYFVFELEFGEKYNQGMIKDCEGECIDLSSTENLYNYLIELSNEENDEYELDIEDESDFINRWANCKNENHEGTCQECGYYEECLEEAEDNSFGYTSFCDCVLSGGYDSMEDFWECNGI